MLLARRGDRESALRDALAALAADRKPLTVYQVAGIYAQTTRQESDDFGVAKGLLAEAFRRDPSLLNLVSSDPDLEFVRGHESFRQLLAAARLVLTGVP